MYMWAPVYVMTVSLLQYEGMYWDSYLHDGLQSAAALKYY